MNRRKRDRALEVAANSVARAEGGSDRRRRLTAPGCQGAADDGEAPGDGGGWEGAGKGGRQKLRARYLRQQEDGDGQAPLMLAASSSAAHAGSSAAGESADFEAAEMGGVAGLRSCTRKSALRLPAEAAEATQGTHALPDTAMREMDDDDEQAARPVGGFDFKCWECRKGKYKGWKCSVKQCRSDVGSGVKGAQGHTGPNWFDDERERGTRREQGEGQQSNDGNACATSDTQRTCEEVMQSSRTAAWPSTQQETSAKSDMESAAKVEAVALRSGRSSSGKQQTSGEQEALQREQARAEAAAAERDRLAAANQRLKASLQTAEEKLGRMSGKRLGVMTSAELLELQADQQEILRLVNEELVVRDVVAKHPEFVCPLSGQARPGRSKGARTPDEAHEGSKLMVDPVVLADGHTYERANIEEFFGRTADSLRSPITGERLSTKEVMPNLLAKAGIAQALQDARRQRLEAHPPVNSQGASGHQATALTAKVSGENIGGGPSPVRCAATSKREVARPAVREPRASGDTASGSCPHCNRDFLNVPVAQR
jgi:hypothetical protein